MKSFGNHYESFKSAHPKTHHPLSHTHRWHLAQSFPLPIHMSSNLLSIYPTNSKAGGRIFTTSSIKFGLSFVYNPNAMLAIFLGSAFSTPFSLGRMFGEKVRRRTTLMKLYSVQQGSRPTSVYASKFHSGGLATLQIACGV